jgi:hypothetical protein
MGFKLPFPTAATHNFGSLEVVAAGVFCWADKEQAQSREVAKIITQDRFTNSPQVDA